MTESAYDRAIQAAKEQYITGDISIYRFELIVEDAMRRRDALESARGEWEQFAHDHNIDIMVIVELEGGESNLTIPAP